MIFFDYQVLLAAAVMVLMVLAPIYAWPETRKLTLPVLGFYVLFLWLNSEFVFGKLGTGHDVVWNWHSWSVVIQQWILSDVSLGWNPYGGAGQPFALYNNVSCYLPAIAFSHFFNLLGLSLPPTAFFNLIFLFGYFNICTGSLLLFRLLYKNYYICLFGFATMLFGGLFYSDIFQSALYILCFLPYFLFLLINFYRTKSPGSLVFFCLLLGLSVNFSLPTYNFITLLIFLFISLIAGLAKPGRLKEDSAACLKAMVSNPRMILLALALFLCTAAPFIANYAEFQDYVSPSRGFSTDARPTQLSYQDSVTTPISANSYLFDYDPNRGHTRPESFLIKTHGTFYIGVMASLGFLIAIFLGGNRVLVFFSGMLVVIAAGHQTPVWEWLMKYIPLADIMRHSFPFAKLAGFAVVTTSLGGLTALISENISSARKATAIFLAALILGYFFPKELRDLQAVYFFTSIAALILISLKWPSNRLQALAVSLPVLVAIQCLQLLLYSAHQQIPPATHLELKEIVYPEKWASLPGTQSYLPFNYTSMVNKIPTWSEGDPNHLFMLQKDFARFLLHNNLLVKKDPRASRKGSGPQGLPLREMKGDIFNLVPYREGVKPDLISLQALKRIINITEPMLQAAGGSPDSENLRAVLDNDIATSWQAKPGPNDNPPWIAFSIQEGFAPDRLEIWYEPSFRIKVDDQAELWLSDDNQTWEFAQKLKRESTPAGKPQDSIKYILEKAIPKKYFKLVFKGEHPESVAEVALVESKATTPPANLIKAGALHQIESKSSNRVELDVMARQDAYILRLENYHPGWQALMDGEEVPILRVYPNFQMVFVPAGEHKLTFEFHSIYYSLVILNIATGFLGGAGFLFWLANLNLTGIRARFNLRKFFPSREPAVK